MKILFFYAEKLNKFVFSRKLKESRIIRCPETSDTYHLQQHYNRLNHHDQLLSNHFTVECFEVVPYGHLTSETRFRQDLNIEFCRVSNLNYSYDIYFF